MPMSNRKQTRAFAAASMVMVVLLSAGATADASISTLFSKTFATQAADQNASTFTSIKHQDQDAGSFRLGAAGRCGKGLHALGSFDELEELENLTARTRIKIGGTGNPLFKFDFLFGHLFTHTAPANFYPFNPIACFDSRVIFATQSDRCITITDLPPPSTSITLSL